MVSNISRVQFQILEGVNLCTDDEWYLVGVLKGQHYVGLLYKTFKLTFEFGKTFNNLIGT